MKKIVYKVHSINEYKKDGDKPAQIYIRIDQELHEDGAFAEMDSTVYDIDDFKDIHELYIMIQEACKKGMENPSFEYAYTQWTIYKKKLHKELMSMV